MLKNHMVGLTPAFDNPNFKLMRDAGFEWVRQGYAFPFEDRIGGKLSEGFLRSEKLVDRFLNEGFHVLASFPGPGSMRYVPEAGKTVYHRAMPAWMGALDEDGYYAMLFEAARWLGDYTKDKITYWQIANEPDIDIFFGPLTREQNVRWLLTAARGVKAGNPKAQCGINLGFLNDYARFLMKEIYTIDDSPFDYLGIDGYMGSWQAGGPDTWHWYIDEVTALCGKPVIINEWGYSSLQWGEKQFDLELKNHYNQDVCRHKYWDKVWGKGHTSQAQAEYVVRCQKIFAEHPNVIGNFFFRWSDTDACWQCGESDCPAECAWGCVSADETPKPAYWALKEGNKKYFGKG
jgi:hypothetical protein